MADYPINVPRLDWLIGGSRIGMSYNRYYGSCGTDGEKGFLSQKIFNYTVWIEKIEETEYLKALVYYGHNALKNTAEEDIEEETFPFAEESLQEIKKWLYEKAEAYLG